MELYRWQVHGKLCPPPKKKWGKGKEKVTPGKTKSFQERKINSLLYGLAYSKANIKCYLPIVTV